MAGLKSLRKLQLGREVTAGTEVAATTLWRGSGALQDDIEIVFVDEDIGVFSGSDRTYVSKFGGSLTMDETPASFQQVGYLFDAGIELIASGSADGAGSNFIYTYDVATTAAPTTKTYTIEGGDNQQEEQMLFCYVESFTLSGVGGGPLNNGGAWKGRQVNPGTFTAAQAAPTVEEILFSKGVVYLDASGGTIGTTQVSDTLLAATVNVSTGIIPKWTTDGSLDFSFIQYTEPEVTLDVTFEHNASAVTEKANWRAETVRLLQLKFEGSAFTTGGTTYSNHTLIVNLAGKWESFAALTDQDGNDIVTGTLRAKYSATDTLFGQFIVSNELTALT